ncbi:MAG: DEAD/DEAH box helicase [Defluviitaleaceae bacterium]|nr:DEAD/DEAH box helicase [Defluviitaleaceae bacterium]
MPASQTALTKGAILNLSSNPDVYERGERYYRDGKLITYKQSEDTVGEAVVRATIEGNYKNYDVVLKLNPDGTLANYTCSCESHSIWRGACKHVVAALFAQAEGQAPTFTPEKMRQHAKSLTDSLEKLIFEGIDESLNITQTAPGQLVKLVPVLNCVGKREIHLTLTIGCGRMYVIKSVPAFVASCKREETVTYGQGLTISHRRDIFDEQSQAFLDFVIREEDLYAEISKRLSRQLQYIHRSQSSRREIYLTERNIDEFFEIMEGQVLEASSDFGNQILMRDGTPPFSINVTHSEDGTTLQSEHFPYRPIMGNNAYYMFTAGRLNKLPKPDGRLVMSLLKAFDDSPGREIVFSGSDRGRFLSVVLPQLARMGLIGQLVGEAPVEQNMDLHSLIYFDSEGQDVTGKLEFHYDNEVINPLTKQKDIGWLIRDTVNEYAIKRRLAAHGFYEDTAKKVYRLTGNDLVYAFLRTGLETLRQSAEVYVSEDLQKKTVRAPSPQMGLRLSGNLLNVNLEDAGYNMNELLEALDAYRARKKFFRLKDGRFLEMDNEAIAATAELIHNLDITRKDIDGTTLSLPAYKALYIDELTRTGQIAETHTLKRNAQFEKLTGHFQNNDALGFKVPKTLDKTLREYQKTGYTWLKTLSHYGFGGILADDMGLGKTLQVITLLLSEKRKNQVSLVVAPTSLLYNWENEISRFAPKLRTQIVSGLPEKRRDLLATPNIDVFITTYDMLKRDVEFYEPMKFAYIIADEAQNIKNPSTQAAKSIKELDGRVRFALTGTPIENNLTELWSIFDFIMPGYLHTAHKFQMLYETPIIKGTDMSKAAQLRQQIAPFVLRRVKNNVLKELPEKIEKTLQAELTPEQKKIYHAYLMEALGALDDIVANDTFADNRMRILAQLTRLRQICCHPALFLDDYEGGSGKMALTLETIQIALDSGHRVLLFSQFTAMLDMLKNELDKTGMPASYFYLDGSTKAKERMEMTTRFNAGEKDIFFISLKAGGTGLNLTGADVVIHYDPWWNPSVMDQASDRAHRYGQKKAVQVLNIVAKDSIEEKIMALQDRKRGLIDSVITEGGSFINLLSEEEVRKLFTS